MFFFLWAEAYKKKPLWCGLPISVNSKSPTFDRREDMMSLGCVWRQDWQRIFHPPLWIWHRIKEHEPILCRRVPRKCPSCENVFVEQTVPQGAPVLWEFRQNVPIYSCSQEQTFKISKRTRSFGLILGLQNSTLSKFMFRAKIQYNEYEHAMIFSVHVRNAHRNLAVSWSREWQHCKFDSDQPFFMYL